ncbi:hypothetical protein [Streptomyces sp. NPDC002550]
MTRSRTSLWSGPPKTWAPSPGSGWAVGYGPTGADLAERICAQIRAWSPARTVEPVVTAYPAATPHSDIAGGAVINRPFARLVITY